MDRMSCSGGGALLGVVMPNADAARDFAWGMEVGVEVGLTAWKSFWTSAGISVPGTVPLAIASKIISLVPLIKRPSLTSHFGGSIENLSDIAENCRNCTLKTGKCKNTRYQTVHEPTIRVSLNPFSSARKVWTRNLGCWEWPWCRSRPELTPKVWPLRGRCKDAL